MGMATRALLLSLLAVFVAVSPSSAGQITSWPDGKKGAVSITFDDGLTSQISLGIPALDARGMKATFFVVSDWAGYWNTWDSWRAAAAEGHEVASHTVSHVYLTTLSLSGIQSEMQGAKTAIEAQIPSKKVATIAYPFGDVNNNVEATAQNIYIAGRGVQCALNDEFSDFYNLGACSQEYGHDIYAQTNAAETQGKWLVTFFHSLNGGSDGWGPLHIADLTSYLDFARTKNLWIGDFGSVAKYIKERESATLSIISSSDQQIVLNLTDALDDSTYDAPLSILTEVPASWTSVRVSQGSNTSTVIPDSNVWPTVPVALDSFNRTNAGNLGSNWGSIAGYSNIGIISNRAAGINSTPQANIYTGADFLADQYSQVKMSFMGSAKSVIVRASASVNTSYMFTINNDNTATLNKVVAGSWTALKQFPSAGFKNGDLAKIAVMGTNPATIYVIKNESLLGIYTDSSNPIQSGRPGIAIWSNVSSAMLDNWEGGNFVDGATRNAVFSVTPDRGLITLTNGAILPQITALNPQSVAAGSNGFTLQVSGGNFASESIVRWNGSDRPTTFVSATLVSASISAADVVTSGTIPVTVFNASSGLSNTASFTIQAPNPVPVVSSLSPSSAAAGSAAFTLTVNGSNFINGSVVRWKGSNRTTTYGSATQLTASISASDIAAAGTAAVTVYNPTPGGGVSNTVNFTIQTANPVPVVSSLSPSSATAGSAAFTLTVNGSNFINGSVVRWKGSNRTTTYGSATQLTASISASDVAAAGTAAVTVYNPTPGGGVSNTVNFTIQATSLVPTSLTLNPSTVTGRYTSQGTVVLSGPAPTGGVVVSLRSSNTSVARVPSSVTVAGGSTSATFTVTTYRVYSSKSVTISGSYAGVTKSATLTVKP